MLGFAALGLAPVFLAPGASSLKHSKEEHRMIRNCINLTRKLKGKFIRTNNRCKFNTLLDGILTFAIAGKVSGVPRTSQSLQLRFQQYRKENAFGR